MAKKRSSNKPELPEFDADQEDLAYALTILINVIAPAIDKGATFDLLYELLNEEMSEETMLTYGALIRATAFGDKQEVH